MVSCCQPPKACSEKLAEPITTRRCGSCSAVEEIQLGVRDLLAQHAKRQSSLQQRFDDRPLGLGEVVDENLGAVHGRVLRGEHLLDAIDGRRGADDAFDLVEIEVDDEAVHGAQVDRVRQDPTRREPGEQLPGELLISDEAGLGDTQARAVVKCQARLVNHCGHARRSERSGSSAPVASGDVGRRGNVRNRDGHWRSSCRDPGQSG